MKTSYSTSLVENTPRLSLATTQGATAALEVRDVVDTEVVVEEDLIGTRKTMWIMMTLIDSRLKRGPKTESRLTTLISFPERCIL
jgi:hypothetical protein